MKHKKIIALLLAAAIMGSLVGCKAGSKSGNGQPSDGEFTPPSFETEAPIQSNAQQAVGKVTAIDGTKITVELGELKSRTPGDGGNGGNRERPDGNSGNKKERPSDFTRPSGDGNGNGHPLSVDAGIDGEVCLLLCEAGHEAGSADCRKHHNLREL